MRALTGSERVAVRYLLGRLPAGERDAFEARYFADAEVFESVCAVEDALIGAYLRGELPPWTRWSFRRRYLSDPRRRERVEFVARLIEVSRAPSLAAPRAHGLFVGWPAAATAVAAVVVCFAGTWVAYRGRLASYGAALSARPPAPVFAVFLTPGQLRGGGGPRRWRVPANAGQVSLRMEIPPGEPASGYRANVATPEGVTVWEAVDLSADAAGVVLLAPAAALPAGDYIVRLEARRGSGFESVEDYAFSVAN